MGLTHFDEAPPDRRGVAVVSGAFAVVLDACGVGALAARIRPPATGS
jgi:hypothetical protein